MNTLIRYIGTLAFVACASSAVWAADDYKVEQEHWFGGTTGSWTEADPDGRMSIQWSPVPPGGHALAGRYATQGAPFPETDAFVANAASSGGKFTGNYRAGGLVPHSLSFKFLAAEVLPSSLLLRFYGTDGGGTQSFFTSLTSQLTSIGTWHYLTIPLQYDPAVWTGGTGAAFTNALGDVQSVEVRVTRAGEQGQTFFIDDFALTRMVPSALATIDSDGDGMPDFWEEQFFGGPTNGMAGVDGDGDRTTNLQEFHAQTDPTEGLSTLQIEKLAHHPLSWVLSFEGELGRTYQVQSSPNPPTIPWNTLTDPVEGQGTLMSITYTNDTVATWFRIQAQRP